MRNLVLDISKWDDIDLQAWKEKYGLWAVIIKAGGNERKIGRYVDSKLEQHYQAAKAAGLHIGFYYYTDVVDIASANGDANHFMRIIGNRDFDMPLYMDVEDTRQMNLPARDLTDVIKSFCDTLVLNGKYAGLYTSGNAWLNNMFSDELTDYANWIAWWRREWPSEAGDIGMWQQGTMNYDTGSIYYDDVSGCVDCDWCVVDYPSRIKSGQSKADNGVIEIPEIQNGSETKTSGRASDVIGAAYGELGYYAPDDPERGSKYGRWLAELTGEDWLAGPSWEIFWCCMFASWCLDKGGVQMDGFPTQNTDLALNGGAKKYAVPIESVRYGDIVIFNWDWDNTTDHIGFATGEFDGTGFTTIEGNVGNAVKEKYRQLGNVAYVLRPPYDGYGVVDGNTPSVSTDPKNNRDGGKLEVDGIGGWNTIIDWQNQIRVIEDGWIDGQDRNNYQFFKGISNVRFNEIGSKTVITVQSIVGAVTDGIWGKETSTKIQQWLESHNYNTGGVDGYFGPNSVKALQKSLNEGAWKV